MEVDGGAEMADESILEADANTLTSIDGKDS